MERMRWIAALTVRLFFVWVVLAGLLGGARPEWFVFAKPYLGYALGVIMFGMGLTLETGDFRRVFARPRAVVIGVGLQYLVMPLLAFALAWALDFNPVLAGGLVLLGCCPGGTASNVICYLARADVALSVSLTAVSTLLSPLLTPLGMYLLASGWIGVEFFPLLRSILLIVFLPVAGGLLARGLLGRRVERIYDFLPLVSVAAILLVVGVVVAENAADLRALTPLILLAVVLHNGGGLLGGYYGARALGLGVAQRRTVAIEVGMQNSGLAAVLALAHLSPEAALPAVVFSVWHNLSGSLLAGFWRKADINPERI